MEGSRVKGRTQRVFLCSDSPPILTVTVVSYPKLILSNVLITCHYDTGGGAIERAWTIVRQSLGKGEPHCDVL